MASSDEIRRALAVVAAAYPHVPLTEHTIELWCRILEDVPIEAVTAACLDYVSSPNAFFPAVGVIRESALEAMEPPELRLTAGEAWAEVRQRMSSIGAYGVPRFSNPTIQAAVEATGGWKTLCWSEEHVADRARFLQAYTDLAQRDRTQRRRLPEARKLIEQAETKVLE